MGFAVGLGIGRYAVVIGHTGGGGSRTVLDSRGQLPAGDLFAVTLITPGTYRATNLASQARLQITVAMPRRDAPYSPARPTLVRAGDQGFDPAEAHILAGQSIVLLAETPGRFLVEPAPPDSAGSASLAAIRDDPDAFGAAHQGATRADPDRRRPPPAAVLKHERNHRRRRPRHRY